MIKSSNVIEQFVRLNLFSSLGIISKFEYFTNEGRML